MPNKKVKDFMDKKGIAVKNDTKKQVKASKKGKLKQSDIDEATLRMLKDFNYL